MNVPSTLYSAADEPTASVVAPPAPDGRRGTVVVSSTASDSHTWNLVFLQLLIEELGFEVVNLGPTVPDELLVERCVELDPVLVVISSVNGHGYQDGLRIVDRLRACDSLAGTPLVIGGKLGVDGAHGEDSVQELLAAGYDAVFQDGADNETHFRGFLRSVAAAARPELPVGAEVVA